mmetsp:Transcript_16328/g.51223  ORF Transcript_16328/g.51223 Transcript_16328/m.51223 type:complete len:84 (-) Transcript_16328:12-263(-)
MGHASCAAPRPPEHRRPFLCAVAYAVGHALGHALAHAFAHALAYALAYAFAACALAADLSADGRPGGPRCDARAFGVAEPDAY